MIEVVFRCREEHFRSVPHPTKAMHSLPPYYKALRSQSPDGFGTAKSCIPFLEATGIGYVIPLWGDLHISASGGKIDAEIDMVGCGRMPVPRHSASQLHGSGLETILKLTNPWVVETPPGVSCLFTNPMNRTDRSITIFDGIVDTDTYYGFVNFPFALTGDCKDMVVPAGTPIAQILPFVRAASELQVQLVDPWKVKSTSYKLGKHDRGGYRNEFWSGPK